MEFSVKVRLFGSSILLNDKEAETGTSFQLNQSDVKVLELPGGGGFGAARERTTNLHKMDIEDGLLSLLIDINT